VRSTVALRAIDNEYHTGRGTLEQHGVDPYAVDATVNFRIDDLLQPFFGDLALIIPFINAKGDAFRLMDAVDDDAATSIGEC
jgi:hypothetical protein